MQLSNTEPVNVITAPTVLKVNNYCTLISISGFNGGKTMSTVIVCGAFAAVLVAKWRFFSKAYAAK